MASQHKTLWQNYDRFAMARGELIRRVLESLLPIKGKQILDLGCGHGGAALALAAAGASLTAIDIDAERLAALKEATAQKNEKIEIARLPANALNRHGEFDLIIIWDVLEHLDAPDEVLSRVHRALRPQGFLLLATPNRQSLVNLFADPHYGLPGLSLCRRRTIKKIISGFLHWHPEEKVDYPELLSWRELEQGLHQAGFSCRMINRLVVQKALDLPEGLWNRPWHLAFINKIKTLGMQRWAVRAASDCTGSIARRLQPTFYILGQKNAPIADI